jgi:hypothetical protein
MPAFQSAPPPRPLIAGAHSPANPQPPRAAPGAPRSPDEHVGPLQHGLAAHTDAACKLGRSSVGESPDVAAAARAARAAAAVSEPEPPQHAYGPPPAWARPAPERERWPGGGASAAPDGREPRAPAAAAAAAAAGVSALAAAAGAIGAGAKRHLAALVRPRDQGERSPRGGGAAGEGDPGEAPTPGAQLRGMWRKLLPRGDDRCPPTRADQAGPS